jgi:hypothetical protein
MRPFRLWLPFLVLLAACAPAPLRDLADVSLGDTLFRTDFSAPDAFETGDFPEQGASLRLEDGRYHLRQSGNKSLYIWGRGGESAADVAVEVLAEVESDYANNLYGVLCRTDENGAGYAFLISSDGFGAIARADGRSLSFIYDWHQHKAIRTDAPNRIRGICVGDYLALVVNGVLVGDAQDTRYLNAGQAGLLGGILVEGRDAKGELSVFFDDLNVRSARLR